MLLLLSLQWCSAAPHHCDHPPGGGPGGGGPGGGNCPAGYAYVCPTRKDRCTGPGGDGCCEECLAGQFQPNRDVGPGTLCKACPGGKYTSAVRGSVCKTCPSGQFSAVSASLCTPCAAGTFSHSADAASCAPCPSGKFVATAGATACTAWTCCPAGHYMTGATAKSNSTCTVCGAGTFEPDQTCQTAVTCKMCPAGQYANQSEQSVCKRCPAGKYQPISGKIECKDCPAGRAGSGSAGTSEDTACAACPKGTFAAAASSTVCTPCVPGWYGADMGAQKCTPCATGRYQPAPSITTAALCAACRAGTVANRTGSAVCSKCSPGSSPNMNSSATFCEVCPSGRFTNPGCVNCPAGKFSGKEGLAACALCPRGQYEEMDGQASCTLCAVGRFQASEGVNTHLLCEACVKGKFAGNPGSTSCGNCAKGSAPDLVQAATTCVVCQVGQFAQPAMFPCSKCQPGQFANASSASSCQSCSPGHSAAQGGSSRCASCAAGQYQPARGRSSCESCAPGKHGDPTVTAATSETEMCAACAAGEYQPASAQAACLSCTAGKYRDDVAGPASSVESVACDVCSYGQYQPAPAQTSCLTCNSSMCPAGNILKGCGSDDPGSCQDAGGGSATSSTKELVAGLACGMLLVFGFGFVQRRLRGRKSLFSRSLRTTLLGGNEMTASWLKSAHASLLGDYARGGSGVVAQASSTSRDSSSAGDNVALINYSEITLGARIASGAQGIVYKGTYSGSPVAVKELISLLTMGGTARSALQELRREARMLTVLRHPNIVVFYGVAVRRDESMAEEAGHMAQQPKGTKKVSTAEQGRLGALAQSRFYLVTELCAASLKELEIHDGTSRADLRLSGFLHALLVQVVAGMAYLHENGVVHRDLKKANVLLTDGGVPKVCDFGLACVSEDSSANAFSMTAARGTPTHMAPELIASGRVAVSNTVDVYSFGCMAWALWTGKEPFVDANPELTQFALMSAIVEGARPEIPPDCPPQFAQLLHDCWSAEAQTRPSFATLSQRLEAPGGCGLNEA